MSLEFGRSGVEEVKCKAAQFTTNIVCVEGKAETNRIENYTFVATEKLLSELGSVDISETKESLFCIK
jgi:hypothetical protein